LRKRAALLGLALLVGCGSSSTSTAPTPSASASDVAVIKVGGSPCGVVGTPVGVFVTDAAAGRLLLVDPATHAVTQVATLDATPCELTYAFDQLWVSTQSGQLDRVDVRSFAVTKVPVGDKSYEVEQAAGAMWVSDRDSAQLTRVDPVSLKTSVLSLPGTKPGGLVFAFGSLWVGDDTAGATSLLRIDPVRRTVDKVAAGHRPAYVTATTDAVWVSNLEDGTVSRIDPRALTSKATKVGLSPVNLDVLADRVWVPDDGGDVIVQLTQDGAVANTYPAPGGGPAVVAPVGGQLWATLFTSGEVWAITPR
jgi:streptogramin lyase